MSTRFFLILSLLLVALSTTGGIRADLRRAESFEMTNAGLQDIQVSAPITGTAMDLRTNRCLTNAVFNASAGSTLIVDPSDPRHLVGATNFIYDFASNFFSASAGEVDSENAGGNWVQHLVTGIDCNQPNFSETVGTYDPSIAIDRARDMYVTVQPVFRGHFPVYVMKSTDRGLAWALANSGRAVFDTQQLNLVSGKGSIIIDNFPNSPHSGTIYVVWVTFVIGKNLVGGITISRSTDQGTSFSQPVRVSPLRENESFVNPIPAIAPDGTLYLSFASMTARPTAESYNPDYGQRTEYVVKSTDGGMTFTGPVEVTTTIERQYENTLFNSNPSQSFVVNPTNGHLLMAVERPAHVKYKSTDNNVAIIADRSDVTIYESVDGGQTWSIPQTANDTPPNENETVFQPALAVSANGLAAAAFYDRRLPCPNKPWILANDVGKQNLCIDTAIQFYNDTVTLTPIGANIRVTKYSWDPMNPGNAGRAAGLNHLWYLGDHFGLAMTNATAYPLFDANFDLGDNPGHNLQLFVASVNVTTKAPPAEQTSQTNISQQQTVPGTGQGLQLIAVVVLTVVAATALISLKKKESIRRVASK
jgi:BNR repeat protein